MVSRHNEQQLVELTLVPLHRPPTPVPLHHVPYTSMSLTLVPFPGSTSRAQLQHLGVLSGDDFSGFRDATALVDLHKEPVCTRKRVSPRSRCL